MPSGGLIPGVEIVKRPLHVFYLLDCSTSMAGARMNAVNQGVPAATHALAKAMKQHPEVEVFVHIMRIATECQWLTPDEGVLLGQLAWKELVAEGKSRTGQAINMLCERLEVRNLGSRGYPPVCILTSDGFFTDRQEYYDGAIERLDRIPWGVKAVRLAMAIGSEEFYDKDSLSQFCNQGQLIQIEHYKEIAKYIQWATVAATVASTRSKSQVTDGKVTGNVVLPAIPKPEEIW